MKRADSRNIQRISKFTGPINGRTRIEYSLAVLIYSLNFTRKLICTDVPAPMLRDQIPSLLFERIVTSEADTSPIIAIVCDRCHRRRVFTLSGRQGSTCRLIWVWKDGTASWTAGRSTARCRNSVAEPREPEAAPLLGEDSGLGLGGQEGPGPEGRNWSRTRRPWSTHPGFGRLCVIYTFLRLLEFLLTHGKCKIVLSHFSF